MHTTTAQFEAALADILSSPSDNGTVALIVVRPQKNERTTPHAVLLTPEGGIQGDRWVKSQPAPDPAGQVSLMNVRVLSLVAGEPERMSLAGDNFIVDLDLSEDNIRPGQRLKMGQAILEISGLAHTGCSKFKSRFGQESLSFINAKSRQVLHLRGVYARVVEAGLVTLGDQVYKLVDP